MPAASSGLQGGMFGGSNTGALMNLYERAVAAGMDPQRAAQIVASDVAPEQFLAQIQQLESRASLGSPVYTPQRTTQQTQVNNQAAAQQARAQQVQQAAALAASRQLTPEQQAIEARYGNDMSWLDPSFQYQAQTMAPVTTQDALQYGTTADPEAQAMQRRAVDQLFNRANAGPSGDERYAMGQLSGSISNLNRIADRGATEDELRALTGMSGAANDLVRRGRAGATGDERAALDDQRRAMDAMFGDYERGASDVELEAQGGQRRAMNELFGLWEGGGATALERARRGQARAESENWLEGQRRADMQDLRERGMAGGGAELASLQADRQAAGSRLSMADLETDAALEQRAMEALLSGGAQAGELLAGESAIQGRRTNQLFGASDAARGISNTLGGIEDRSSQQLASGGGLLGNVAQGFGGIENRGLSARLGAANAANAYGGLAGDVESRALQALLGAQSGAGAMRDASDAYVQGNADRLFNAAEFNANAINQASADNKAFMQNAYRDTMADRMRWDLQTRDLQAAIARDLLGSDVQETQFGYGQGLDVAEQTVNARNRGQDKYNAAVLGAYTGTSPAVYDAAGQQSGAAGAGLRAGAQTVQQAGNAFANYFSGGMAGMAGGMGRQPYSSGVTGNRVYNPTDAQNPYRNPGYT